MNGLINQNKVTINPVSGVTIYNMIKSAPKGVSIYTFYSRPSDAPPELNNWNYLLLVMKVHSANGETDQSDRCLLFYPNSLYTGRCNESAVLWSKISFA